MDYPRHILSNQRIVMADFDFSLAITLELTIPYRPDTLS